MEAEHYPVKVDVVISWAEGKKTVRLTGSTVAVSGENLFPRELRALSDMSIAVRELIKELHQ